VFWLVEAYAGVDLGCLSSDDALSFWYQSGVALSRNTGGTCG
jgi:hypothetical protein